MSSTPTARQLQSAVRMVAESIEESQGLSTTSFWGTPSVNQSLARILMSYPNGSYISMTGLGFYTGSRLTTLNGLEVFDSAGSGFTASMVCDISMSVGGAVTAVSGTVLSMSKATPYAGIHLDYSPEYFSANLSSSGAVSDLLMPSSAHIRISSLTAWHSVTGGGRANATESLTLSGSIEYDSTTGIYSGIVTSLQLTESRQTYEWSGFSLPVSTFVNGTTDASFFASMLGLADAGTGSGGNDVLTDLPDIDNFDGGAGVDTVVFSGSHANFTITKIGGNYRITENLGTGSPNTLTNVERLQFDDTRIALDVTGPDQSGHASAGQIYRLYQAAFNRSPDKAGLGYWIGQADESVSLTTIARGFTGSLEFENTYGSINDHQFVDRLYQNVLHRSGESAGMAYWYGQIDSHAQTREQILVGFSESAENQQALIGVIQNGIVY